MSKIYVVYWSQTGNTQAMAEALGEGIAQGGKEGEVVEVSAASLDDLKGVQTFALGCPAMGAEVRKKWKWNLMWRKWRSLQPAKISLFLALRLGRRRVDERLGRADEDRGGQSCWR